MGAGADDKMVLSVTCNAPAFTVKKKAHCEMKFVKWFVRKNRDLTMVREDNELNECSSYVKSGPRLSKVL